MFKCEVTGAVSKPGEPMFRVVVETRPVTYTNWRTIYHLTRREPTYEEHITKGFETVRELKVSAVGKAQLEAEGRSHAA